MKKLSILFISSLIFLSVEAQRQQRVSAVTVTIAGNKNATLTIDGTVYAGKILNDRSTIAINNLGAGQHSLLVSRGGQYNNNRSEMINTSFNLRNRFDMLVKVNADGSLELIETKRSGNNGSQARISTADFNKLWSSVRSQRSNETKRSLISNAFNNVTDPNSPSRNQYFTSTQVAQLLRLVTVESYRLQLAKLAYPVIADPVNFRQVYVYFSQAGKNELDYFVNNYDDSYTEPVTLYTPMSDANFNSLYQSIRRQWNATTQYTALSNAFNNSINYFSTSQARQLIQLTLSEYNRLQLAKLSYKTITDPEDFSQMGNVLNTQASRDELTVYVNNYRAGNTNQGSNVHVAMDEVSFNTLLRNLNYQFLPGEQMNSLVGIFNNSSNYFNSGQVKQLIELVSLETNRLQLAKLSYRSLVDRNNFTQLYDLFNTQASKNELDAYAYAYRD